MDKLKGYQERLTELQGLVDQLALGKLSVDGLALLEKTTRELHERSIILKYKAFENTSSVMSSPIDSVEETIIEKDIEPIVEIEEEAPKVELEEQPFDFSLFNDENIEEEIKPTIEESSQPEINATDFNSEPEVEVPAPAEVEIVEAEKAEEESEVIVNTVSFLDKFSSNDNSVASRFAEGKLDSLIGAFGLNQKLRFINELFDGSSEAFSDAIKTLDSQESLLSAKEKASKIAQEQSWDLEDECVGEFMVYIQRRYA